MFIVRSAFWLGLAVVVMNVNDWDGGSDARAMGEQALRAGQTVLASQVNAIECRSIECAGGKALLLASGLTANPLAASPMQDLQASVQAPVPRPRLERAG